MLLPEERDWLVQWAKAGLAKTEEADAMARRRVESNKENPLK